MAYNVYFACDRCGIEGAAWTNRSVSLTTCAKFARAAGWIIGKHGWICPVCQRRRRSLRN